MFRLIGVALWWFCHLVGLRWMWEKINPPSTETTVALHYRKPSSFLIWILGIYFAIFGFASARYERSINDLTLRITVFLNELNANAAKYALETAGDLLNYKVPLEPSLGNYSDVLSPILSLFISDIHEPSRGLVQSIILAYKEKMPGCNLERLDMKGLRQFSVNLQGSHMKKSTWYGDNLVRSDFSGSFLSNVDLNFLIIGNVNFGKSTIVDLKAVGMDKPFDPKKVFGEGIPCGNTSSVIIDQCNFTGAKIHYDFLHNAQIGASNFSSAEFKFAKIINSSFFNCTFENTTFDNCALVNCCFYNCSNLSPRSFSNVTSLSGCVLPDTREFNEFKRNNPALFEKDSINRYRRAENIFPLRLY